MAILRTLWVCLLLQFSFTVASGISKPFYGIPHLDTAIHYVGYREVGNNRGSTVDRWNRFVGNPLGSPYCAAYCSWCLNVAGAGYPKIKTGWSRGFIVKHGTPWERSITAQDVWHGKAKPEVGWLVIWVRNGGGHIGFVVRFFTAKKINTVEANTGSGDAGSQHDGGGVYQRVRSINPYSKFRITHFTRVSYE